MESYIFVITPTTVRVDNMMDYNYDLYDPMMGLSPTTRTCCVVQNMTNIIGRVSLHGGDLHSFDYSLHEENTLKPRDVAFEIVYRLQKCFAGKALIGATIITEEGLSAVIPGPRVLIEP